MSEEKKLTDEEIVKAFELCVMDGVGCAECPYSEYAREGLGYCNGDIEEDVLDLIHRLQDENKTLKSPKYGRWKVKFFNAQDKIAELQKKVDELLQEKGYLIERRNAGKKQAVKDTAKEIIQWIKRNGTLQYGGYVIHDSTIEQMCKKYGVEVE